MGKIAVLLLAMLIAPLPPAANAATTWCVDAAVSSSGDGTTWETAFKKIQEGIDAASEGDIVIVAEEMYTENVRFSGKNIVLRSTDPFSSDAVRSTIIDGGGVDSVVRFSGSENATCVLSGFTLQNGFYTWGGGIFGNASRATIQNNVIRNNKGTQGGGLAYCHGVVRNNVISDNDAVQEGGGLHRCHGEVENNTIVGNSAERGGGLYGYEGTIRNCIIWGNVAQVDEQVSDIVSPTYCCIQNWERGGEGNISWFPYFVDPDGEDYHLLSWSPSIDAGDRLSDFSSEPEPNGSRINMGAYGNSPEAAWASADSDGDSLPDDWEMHFLGSIAHGASDDPDANGLSYLEEYLAGMGPTVMWYVDAAIAQSGDGKTWAAAFQSIQEGMDAASIGETVVVARGTYPENIRFHGKNIILRSTAPLDPQVVDHTIIDGSQSSPVVTFSGTESGGCILSGFTLRNGEAEYGGGICGGTPDVHTHATIRNNTISGNSAHDGGGLAFCDGIVEHNRVVNNLASHNGGGMYGCNSSVRNNQISDNWADGSGGALSYCDGLIRNNVISRNSTSWGGGLSWCDAVIENNTISDNSADQTTGALYRCEGTLRNCIIWGNRSTLSSSQLYLCPSPEYCCIQGWLGDAGGSISVHPHFVEPHAGDYRLQSWSPCIDVGDPISDFSREPQPNGGRINMGAYGNTEQAASSFGDADQDLLPDAWELHFFGDLTQEPSDDPDRDGWTNAEEYRRGADPSGSATWYVDRALPNSGDGASWESAFKTIQEATGAAAEGDTVIVARGIYLENIVLKGRNIKLMSTDPLDPAVVANTVIDGSRSGPVVTFHGTEDEACVLSGLTIQNGEARYGSGILGSGTHATISNNVITMSEARDNGGGLAFFDGLIENNTISNNTAEHGAGLYRCQGTIRNNRVSGNSVIHNGGGLYGCNGMIDNNKIAGNRAGGVGGGLASCYGTIQYNTITANRAHYSGGGLTHCNGVVANNIISGNLSEADGAGIAVCDKKVLNNTIAYNKANGTGAGLYKCRGTIANCIVWGNVAPDAPQLSECSRPRYSCIQDWTEEGDGNIGEDPWFVDGENGDYRLLPCSLCVDAGDNGATDLSETDISGMHRVMFGGKSVIVDMGAYEFYINDLRPGPEPDQATFTWSSLAENTYSIFYTEDLTTWHLAVESFPSAGNPTISWIDDGTFTGVPPSLAPRRFYRVLENP